LASKASASSATSVTVPSTIAFTFLQESRKAPVVWLYFLHHALNDLKMLAADWGLRGSPFCVFERDPKM
jgi:hypothetical protein